MMRVYWHGPNTGAVVSTAAVVSGEGLGIGMRCPRRGFVAGVDIDGACSPWPRRPDDVAANNATPVEWCVACLRRNPGAKAHHRRRGDDGRTVRVSVWLEGNRLVSADGPVPADAVGFTVSRSPTTR